MSASGKRWNNEWWMFLERTFARKIQLSRKRARILLVSWINNYSKISRWLFMPRQKTRKKGTPNPFCFDVCLQMEVRIFLQSCSLCYQLKFFFFKHDDALRSTTNWILNNYLISWSANEKWHTVSKVFWNYCDIKKMILYIHSRLCLTAFTREMVKRQHAIKCKPRFVSFYHFSFCSRFQSRSLASAKTNRSDILFPIHCFCTLPRSLY